MATADTPTSGAGDSGAVSPAAGTPPTRRPLVWLVVIAAVWIAAALSARSLSLDNDIARMLPDRDPAYERATSFVRHLMARALIDLSLPEDSVPVADPERLAAAADRLASTLSASGHIRSAGPSVDPAEIRAALDVVRARCAVLISDETLTRFAPKLESAALAEHFRLVERRLQEPDGAVFLERLQEDPLGIADLSLAPLGALTNAFGDARIERGYLVDPSGRHALLFVEPNSPPTDTAGSRAFLDVLESSIVALRSDPQFADVVVRHLGAHRATLDNAEQIQSDVKLTSGVGIAAIVVFALLTFSRFVGVLLAMLPAVFGGCVALGLFALGRDSIAGAVAGFGAVLLAITIDYAIHIIFRLDSASESADGEPPRAPKQALMIGASTTAAAFLALLASSLPGIREIGVFGGLGTIAAFGFAIVVLPVLLGRRPSRPRRPFVDLGRLVTAVRSWRWYPVVPIVALLVTPLLAGGLFFLRKDGDLRRLSSLSPEAAADEAAIESAWGSVFRVTTVVVEAKSFDEALRLNESVATQLDRAVSDGRVLGHASVAELLPAFATQDRHWAAWSAFFDEARRADLNSRLASVLGDTVFDPNAFRDSYAWLAERPAPIDETILDDAGFGGLIEDRLFRTEHGFLVATPVFTSHPDQVDALAAGLAIAVPEAAVVDRAMLVRQLGGLVVDEAWTIGLLAFLSVVLIVWLWLARIELVLVIAVPLLVSGVWTLGLLGWLGLPLTLANAVFLAFLFGLAVDYAVFIAHSRLERFRTGRDHTRDAEASVLFCAVTTGTGFGALALAGHPVLYSIGSTALVGIVCAALATQIFVPFLCDLVLRRHGPNGAFHWRYAWPSLFLFAGLIVPAVVFLARSVFIRDPARREQLALQCIQRGAFWVRDRMAIGRREYLGVEPEKFETPCIVVANHESHYDNVALSALPIPLQFLIKPWVRRLPIVGTLISTAGYRVVSEGDAADLVELARDRAARGVSTLSYPEGTRTRTGRMGRFHNGAFALARAIGVDVLPVAMVNTRSAVRPHTWWVGDHSTRVVVLDRVDPGEFDGELADRRMARAIRDRIQATCEEHWLATQTGPRWDRPIAVAFRYLERPAARRARDVLRGDPFVRDLPHCVDGDAVVLFVGLQSAVYLARMVAAYPNRKIIAIEGCPDRVVVARAVTDSTTCQFVTELSECDGFGEHGDSQEASRGESPLRIGDVLLLDGPPVGVSGERTYADIRRVVSSGTRIWVRDDLPGFPALEDWTILRGDRDPAVPTSHAVRCGIVK